MLGAMNRHRILFDGYLMKRIFLFYQTQVDPIFFNGLAEIFLFDGYLMNSRKHRERIE
jgi:hypothetical protein